jgi:Amt family ammonium transporter
MAFSARYAWRTLLLLLLPEMACADALNQANTAWVLTSTVLVLFMTIAVLRGFGQK